MAARPLGHLAGCGSRGRPGVDLQGGDAALIDAAVRLMLGSRIGRAITLQYQMQTTGIGTAGIQSGAGKAGFKIYDNGLQVPVLIAIQPTIFPAVSPVISALYVSPDSSLLAVENDGANEPWVPRAPRRIPSGEAFETVVMPGSTLHGLVVGPPSANTPKYSMVVTVTSLVDALAALEAVRRGLSG